MTPQEAADYVNKICTREWDDEERTLFLALVTKHQAEVKADVKETSQHCQELHDMYNPETPNEQPKQI